MTDIENETRFQQWNERIQAICKDVQGLVIGRFIYKAVQSIVEANDALHHPSAFYDLSASTYAGWAAMGVRRHVDADPDSVSLVNLLDSVAQHPATLSLERFLAPYRAASVFRPKVLEEIGDEYLGRGATQIDPESVRHDIIRLRDITNPIRRYVNKRIAHLDRAEFDKVPSFADLDNALDLLEGLTIKYLHLLTGKQPESLVGEFQYDWQRIFRQPWIIPGGPQ